MRWRKKGWREARGRKYRGGELRIRGRNGGRKRGEVVIEARIKDTERKGGKGRIEVGRRPRDGGRRDRRDEEKDLNQGNEERGELRKGKREREGELKTREIWKVGKIRKGQIEEMEEMEGDKE